MRNAATKIPISEVLSKPGNLLARLLEEVLQPNAGAIAEIGNRDEIAVAVFEPHKKMEPVLRALGWTGKPVFSLTRKRGAETIGMADHVTARWVSGESGGPVHIFVVAQLATFLLNAGNGPYSFEPGSLDCEQN